MTEHDLLPLYLAHLNARVRSKQGRWQSPDEKEIALTNLPPALSALCADDPEACLALIVRALEEPLSAEAIREVGDGLLENLLNEHSGTIADRLLPLLRTNQRFRQAFSFGNYASVDPAVVADWARLFQNLGTTRAAERKSVWRRTS